MKKTVENLKFLKKKYFKIFQIQLFKRKDYF